MKDDARGDFPFLSEAAQLCPQGGRDRSSWSNRCRGEKFELTLKTVLKSLPSLESYRAQRTANLTRKASHL